MRQLSDHLAALKAAKPIQLILLRENNGARIERLGGNAIAAHRRLRKPALTKLPRAIPRVGDSFKSMR
ncbi:hypothetical protein MRA01_55500 [Methylobacterium radiotolerans]|nr:hypothetical protein MRA01_55500 [Methylobacterium radiotolerans]